MVNTIEPRQNKTAVTGRKCSPAIWGDFPAREILDPRSRRDGIYRRHDFSDLPLQGTLTTQISNGQFKVFGDTGNTITRVVSINSVLVPGGAMQLALDTDNDEVAIADAYPSFLMTGLKTNGAQKLCFELCYAQDTVVTNKASVFFGLANVDAVTLSTTVPLNDGDPIDASMYAVGFRIAEDGLGVIDTVRTDGATSFTNIGAGEGGTLVGYTFKKLGLVYDPYNVDRCVRFFTDNVECATALTAAQVVAFTNIDANGLGFLFAATADSAGTTHKSFIKWMQVGQEFVF